MKTKLAVTIDRELLPKAKESARSRGVSLSSVIEQALRDLERGETPMFSQKWSGSFGPAPRKTARYRRLARKYL